MSDEELKWGWCYDGDCLARGPFNSKDAAIRNAIGYSYPSAPVDADVEGPRLIDVGRCFYPDPVIHVDCDLDFLLKRMDEHAQDNEFATVEDAIFEIRGDDAQAKAEYRRVIEDFARKWIAHTGCWVLGDTEKLVITRDGQARPEKSDG
jgi:hypothetical protein